MKIENITSTTKTRDEELTNVIVTFQTLTDIRYTWKQTIMDLAPECFCEGDPGVIDRFYKYAEMPDDPSLKCFLTCCHVKLNIFTPTCGVDAKKWADTFDYVDLALAQMCANFKEPDPCEKSYLMVHCLYKEISKHYPQ